MSKEFRVEVQRYINDYRNYKVVADDEEQAKELALDKAREDNWKHRDDDFKVKNIKDMSGIAGVLHKMENYQAVQLEGFFKLHKNFECQCKSQSFKTCGCGAETILRNLKHAHETFKLLKNTFDWECFQDDNFKQLIESSKKEHKFQVGDVVRFYDGKEITHGTIEEVNDLTYSVVTDQDDYYEQYEDDISLV